MALPVMTRPWFEGRDGHTAEALAAKQRWDEITAEKQEVVRKKSDILHERLQPGYREKLRRVAGELVADHKDLLADPDQDADLQELTKRERALEAGLDVIQERYEAAYKEARNEMALEVTPDYVERLSVIVDCLLPLIVAGEAERRFREPQVMHDIPIRAVPLHAARLDGQLGLWLKRAGKEYPELHIERRVRKAGLSL